MADNSIIRGANSNIDVATDELSDGSQSPKVSLLAGDQSPTPIRPAEALVDNAAFTDGTSKVTPVGYVYDDVAGTALTENDVAAGRIDSKRALVFTVEDATTRGNRAAVKSSSDTTSSTVLGLVTRPVGVLEALEAIAGNQTTTSGQIVVGAAAHDEAVAGAPNRVGARAVAANYTAVGAGDTADLIATLNGALVVRPHSIPAAEWSYAAASGGIDNTTTAVTVKAAGAAGIVNYITSIQICHATLGAATEFAIRDGAGGTVLWRTILHTTALPTVTYNFNNPLRGTAATLTEIVTLTAVTGDVMVNVQGYQAP